MSYWWINTDHWFFLRKLWRKQYINVYCQVVDGEGQPVLHIFLNLSYTGVGAPERLDQALLLLLQAGEAAGGPSCGGGGALGQREEPAHPPRVPGPRPQTTVVACFSRPLSQAVLLRPTVQGTQMLGGRVFSKRARLGVLGSWGT